MQQVEAIRRAVEILGSQEALGEALGTCQATVNAWINRHGQIGAGKALDCHQLTCGMVSAHDLRPDLYPRGEVVIKRRKRQK